MQIELNQLRRVGSQLHRPECCLCTVKGNLYTSDWQGGVTRIAADGSQQAILDRRHGEQLQPNGIALQPDGSFLLANLGQAGGVWHLDRSGSAQPWLVEVAGMALPPCNFVVTDSQQRTWITVSTRQVPRMHGYRADVSDGFIVLVESGAARIVADGLGYTNEIALCPSGDWLYVNETFARRLSRFRLQHRGLGRQRETVWQFGHGCFPDGLAFDQEGGLWITSIVSNRLYRFHNNQMQLILEDSDPQHLNWVEEAYNNHTMQSQHLTRLTSKLLTNCSSIAFGGPDRTTAYLGNLLGDSLFAFDAGVAGAEPAHWHWD